MEEEGAFDTSLQRGQNCAEGTWSKWAQALQMLLMASTEQTDPVWVSE